MDRQAITVIAGIAIIVLAMAFGPLLSPPEFSVIGHTTSEQAGQHMPGAWLMRAGFVAYGAAVLFAAIARFRNAPALHAALALFGLGFVATALWSNAPIVRGVPADMDEDWLHSVASGVVGTAFALACAARLFLRRHDGLDGLALIGLVVSVAIPLAMEALPDIRGLLQRAMFALSFVFVACEFVFASRTGDGAR